MPDGTTRALIALCRLRRVRTDSARRDLAQAVARERAVVEREAGLTRAMDDARRIDDGFDREVYSRWFARMIAERQRMGEMRAEAAALTAAERAELARRRVAETAAEDAVARRMAEAELITARRDQATLEEIARAIRLAGE